MCGVYQDACLWAAVPASWPERLGMPGHLVITNLTQECLIIPITSITSTICTSLSAWGSTVLWTKPRRYFPWQFQAPSRWSLQFHKKTSNLPIFSPHCFFAVYLVCALRKILVFVHNSSLTKKECNLKACWSQTTTILHQHPLTSPFRHALGRCRIVRDPAETHFAVPNTNSLQ